MFRLMTLCSTVLLSSTLFIGCEDATDEIAEGEETTGDVQTVSGEVVKVLDTHSFTMKGEHEWFENEPLVVVTEDELPAGLNDEDEVTVTGTVQNYEIIEVEEELGWDFEPEVEVELEDVKGYLVSSKVVITEHEDADALDAEDLD